MLFPSSPSLNKQSGIYLFDLVVSLMVVVILVAVVTPKIQPLIKQAKAQATKVEMSRIQSMLLVHQMEYGSSPSSLSTVTFKDYFTGLSYQKDEFGASYYYSKTLGKLCSVSIIIDPLGATPPLKNYCLDF